MTGEKLQTVLNKIDKKTSNNKPYTTAENSILLHNVLFIMQYS